MYKLQTAISWNPWKTKFSFKIKWLFCDLRSYINEVSNRIHLFLLIINLNVRFTQSNAVVYTNTKFLYVSGNTYLERKSKYYKNYLGIR
jgi:hypothetical protein